MTTGTCSVIRFEAAPGVYINLGVMTNVGGALRVRLLSPEVAAFRVGRVSTTTNPATVAAAVTAIETTSDVHRTLADLGPRYSVESAPLGPAEDVEHALDQAVFRLVEARHPAVLVGRDDLIGRATVWSCE